MTDRNAIPSRAALAKALARTFSEYLFALPEDHENWLNWADEVISRLEDDDE